MKFLYRFRDTCLNFMKNRRVHSLIRDLKINFDAKNDTESKSLKQQSRLTSAT